MISFIYDLTNKIRREMPLIFMFFGMWLLYFLSFSMISVVSNFEQTHLKAVWMEILFLIIVGIGFIVGKKCFKMKKQSISGKNNEIPEEVVKKIIITFTLLTFIGLCCQFYDKVIVLGVDYSKGIAVARHAWIAAANQRADTGQLSLISVSGHVLSNFYFIPVFLIMLFEDKILSKAKYVYLYLNIIFMLIYSSTMGSRTIPLFFVCFFASLVFLRGKNCTGKLLRKYVGLFICGVVLIAGYNFYIFALRAEKFGNNDIKQYTESFYGHLGGQKKNTNYYEFAGKNNAIQKSLLKVFYYCELTCIYVTHNQWTFDYVLTLDNPRKEVMFRYVWFVFDKLGMELSFNKTPSMFPGRFLSLPGCAYVTYGKIGMFVFAFIFGFIIQLAEILVKIKKGSFFASFFYLMIGVFVLSSIVTSAGNLLPFPYFCCAFFAFFVVIFGVNRLGESNG